MQTPYIYSTKGIFLLRRVSCIKVFSRQSTLSDLWILYSIKISLQILYSIQIVFFRSDAVGGGEEKMEEYVSLCPEGPECPRAAS